VELSWPASCTAPLPPDPATPQAGVWGAHTVCELRVPIRQGAAAPGESQTRKRHKAVTDSKACIAGISQNRERWVHHWVSRFIPPLLPPSLHVCTCVQIGCISVCSASLGTCVCLWQFVCFSTCVCLWALVTHAQHCGKAVGNLPHSKSSRTSNPDLRF
jgi:hypothetical protein